MNQSKPRLIGFDCRCLGVEACSLEKCCSTNEICNKQSKGYGNSNDDDFFNTWELGYNHYHNRKHLEMPFTKQLIATKIRTQSQSDWNIFFETLTHGKEIPNTTKN